MPITNNDILKKLRIALQLKDTDILEILDLVGFSMTKGALNDLFRNEDHPNYVEAGDQVLRNFLNGLIIYKRGPSPEVSPKKGQDIKNTRLDKNFFNPVKQKRNLRNEDDSKI